MPTPQAKQDRRRLIAVITGATLIIGASFGAQAVAESRVFQHAKTFVTEGHVNPFIHKASWGSRRGGFSNLTDAEIDKRVQRAIKHLAIEIDATPEQTAKISTLIAEVAKDMRPLREEFRDAGLKMRDILTAKDIDREALEKLRTERVAEIDKRSKQITTALADVAEVLTAEQRATVQERIEQFRSMRRSFRRWHRG